MEHDALLHYTSQRLVALRKGAGLSQQTLARRAGLSVDSVGKLERGEQLVSLNTLNKLCQALGLPLPEFFHSATGEDRDQVQRTVLELCLYLSTKKARHVRLVDDMARQMVARLEAEEESGD